ncbi:MULTISPECIES: MarR family winged helix-turn-helix transcriptional regulator [Chryseobacterium]|uniref:DNA-binding MarR family transcriptional regulator n=1 Tax=Chryseobacterium camelliae TaxID=1265445 RepID=A0ABU0TE34_9FLAO|nr:MULTISPECIES: MarR family winged helix-turn-helix transcriptional regulator [Chryseobacterium]MDT3406879.1 DNA-binding MarR family transcriptional regulator [Pseudacidovorax intermedius]MDQ1095325.1 DNA-binding MarR family transcriptional regulator [Chryseobacterium camelliae]MDQ1099264.1 DNA-binding MarR family transcriptional regulator [Chryseobacterium sp. SORGH_AS_1048]MDR6086613.1 DNA-binding MarR family transcriptional regulator [Chryseobacterium sp. SORGH_AS_0909]MDR6130983.1 DNA-bin
MKIETSILKDTLILLEQFHTDNSAGRYTSDIKGFKNWIAETISSENTADVNAVEAEWEGKSGGRTAESVISTLLVHLNRYAKAYSRSAIAGSGFATQEDFIFLISLKAFGAMTKMELIKKNVHEKPAGILIINRLIKQGWAEQTDSETDRRTKVIRITEQGKEALENQMHKIRKATHIVAGNLNHKEKLDLIRLLDKLDKFHNPIYHENIDPRNLIDTVYRDYPF